MVPKPARVPNRLTEWEVGEPYEGDVGERTAYYN